MAEPAQASNDLAAAPGPAARVAYRGLLACASLVAAVAALFFVIGLGDGSVSSFNLGLWLLLLAALAAVLWGGRALWARGRRGWAVAVLALVAVPGIVAALLMLLLVAAPPRWN